MYSSKWRQVIAGVPLLVGLLVTYSGTLAARDKTTVPQLPTLCRVVKGKPSAQDAATASALQHSTEISTFYTLLASTAAIKICHLHYHPDGAITLEYQFRKGDRLRVIHDAHIEYTEQNVHFKRDLKEQPEAILARAEYAAFGTGGCGINWQQPETQKAEDNPNLTITLFRGDVCSCQAGISRNADGRVVGLMLRSAC